MTTDEYLRRCVELAAEALDGGDFPFGSVLVGADGRVLAEDRNREVSEDDPTAHPELRLALWSVANLSAEERAASTVYTSGEHCPMCAAAHGWVGLGPIVYAGSAAQLAAWRAGWGQPPSPVAVLPVDRIVPGLRVTGPVKPFDEEMRVLHERAAGR
ncbi:nucleoside deaminase [Actinoplanes sp. LDG1-06]|uniref:Nucleoside deaminase n=1 Tax=Paractinoplanes ovalisporus TaxID=2810368 RepID=A0ABS2A4S6_9ACTN|nr:nucleoside deaminase [Actinoplanes ovalisporus]MBM2614842.1 nucleoside deaminase [Actinoplanes ovalisporus]